ncbi:MAG: helix-turn-helix transcriptional regulator [Anaerolineales bacterium]|jgi:transcriptional regulator with XRE-family HTH domain
MIPEPIGQRVAAYRTSLGWTQQALADRLGISRVAVSHIEADISLPGERTITLLAGLFKIPPYELVSGTTYPQAKVDRLPSMVCSFTSFEMDMALFENDMSWLARIRGSSLYDGISCRVKEKWTQNLEEWEGRDLDESQQGVLEAAREKLEQLE